MSTVVSVFGVEPFRIGGTESFARELSRQLQQSNSQSVLCFLGEPTGEVRSFLDLTNVSLEVVPKATNSTWTSIKSLASIIRKYKPEVLHLHFTGFLGAYPWLARLLSVDKVFFTDHSSRPANYLPKRAPFWKRSIARAVNYPVSKVICVSEFGQRCLTTLQLLPNEDHALVYNAVDLTRAMPDPKRAQEFKTRFSIPENRIVIVQVSWMIPEKGIPGLLETARLLVSKNRNVHFVLVGEGSHRQKFMAQAEAMNLGSHVTWTGLVQDPFETGVYDAADIICQLSDWQELFGWMIAEGMAFGKPIVASNVGGIPELVEDNVTGFLVGRSDRNTAAHKLDSLARDPELRNRMGAAGRALVEKKFDLQRNVAQLLSLYQS